MVSKLNVSPFHKVNSPLEEPVSSRRPSGVHLTTLTGQRTLLVEVWTNLVAIEMDALLVYAFGVKSFSKQVILQTPNQPTSMTKLGFGRMNRISYGDIRLFLNCCHLINGVP